VTTNPAANIERMLPTRVGIATARSSMAKRCLDAKNTLCHILTRKE